MKKNKQVNFTLFKEPWTIDYLDTVSLDETNKDAFYTGWCKTLEHRIEVSTKTMEGKPRSARDIELTRLHELVHCILDTGLYIDLSLDEPMVEWIARCLLDLKEQKII